MGQRPVWAPLQCVRRRRHIDAHGDGTRIAVMLTASTLLSAQGPLYSHQDFFDFANVVGHICTDISHDPGLAEGNNRGVRALVALIRQSDDGFSLTKWQGAHRGVQNRAVVPRSCSKLQWYVVAAPGTSSVVPVGTAHHLPSLVSTCCRGALLLRSILQQLIAHFLHGVIDASYGMLKC